MRVLLAGPLDAGDAVYREVDKYRAAGNDVVVNIFCFDQNQAAKLAERYQGDGARYILYIRPFKIQRFESRNNQSAYWL